MTELSARWIPRSAGDSALVDIVIKDVRMRASGNMQTSRGEGDPSQLAMAARPDLIA